MTDTAQERDWTPEDDIDHAASQLLSLPHEAHSMTEREIITNAVDMGEEIVDALGRLRARQREEGDVDTRTIGLALNDIRSIVRQDWTWTTELQRHYDLAMDALRPESPTEQEQNDG